ncbi:lytic transglycosylase domain-containing protein [bacterium]|nr:lytic transglycosylase domain-containing protein [bacterium]
MTSRVTPLCESKNRSRKKSLKCDYPSFWKDSSVAFLLSLLLAGCAPRGTEKSVASPRVEEIKADSLLALGQYWKALPYYREALEHYKESEQGMRVRAKLYRVFYESREWDSAFVYADALRSTVWHDSLKNKGLCYFRASRFREILSLKDASPMLRAESALLLGLDDTADVLYSEAEKILGEVARGRRAEIYAKTERKDSAITLLSTLKRPTLAQKRLLVQLLFEKQAYSELPGAIAVLSGEAERLEVLIRLYDMVGDEKKKRRTQIELMRVAPWSPGAIEAAKSLLPQDAEESFLLAKSYAAIDGSRALYLFEDAENRGYSKKECRWERSQLLYNLKRYDEALTLLKDLESDEAKFLLAKVFTAKGSDAEAMNVLEDVAANSPNRANRQEAWERQATILQRKGLNRQAAELAAKGASALGDGELGQRALVLWLAEHDTVMAYLALKGGVPLDADAAMFFRIRIHPDSADWILSRLEAKDPFSYYSLSVRGGLPDAPLLQAWFREIGDTTLTLKTAEDSILERQAFMLAEAGFFNDASSMLKLIKDPPLPRVYAWAKKFSELGSDNNAIDWAEILLKEARNRGVRTRPLEVLRLQYPVCYALQIENEAVDTALFLSLTRQESWFNPEARSPANAYGLCQLLLGTARGMDATMTVDSLLKADVSIRLGAQFLKKMQGSFDGRKVAYLAAYNAGPGAVAGWVRYLPEDDALFAELIPYDETRSYVKQLIKGEIIYHSLLNQKGERRSPF